MVELKNWEAVRTSKIRTSNTFDVLFDVLINHFIFDALINLKKDFWHSDPFQIFDQLLDFRCSDFRRSDPFSKNYVDNFSKLLQFIILDAFLKKERATW